MEYFYNGNIVADSRRFVNALFLVGSNTSRLAALELVFARRIPRSLLRGALFIYAFVIIALSRVCLGTRVKGLQNPHGGGHAGRSGGPAGDPDVKKGFVLLPRRWVVERSFGWAARFRRLARDYERLPETLIGLHFLAFANLIAKRVVETMLIVHTS